MWRLLKVLPQYIVPQHGLTSIVYKLTRVRQKALKNILISSFMKAFNIDLSDYERQEPEQFESFNDFFTRELKPSSRPIKNNAEFISPVDGFISEFGTINNSRLTQAKGKDYSLNALLADDDSIINKYQDGLYCTIYLSPKNYHRIHSPTDADLRKATYVPGKLFGVGKSTTNTVNNLFARNERVILDFDTEYGSMCLVMVGAIFVGSMETVWHGQITPNKNNQIKTWQYEPGTENTEKLIGQEIARFNMGSTVILLFNKNSIEFINKLSPGMAIKMGEELAKRL